MHCNEKAVLLEHHEAYALGCGLERTFSWSEYSRLRFLANRALHESIEEEFDYQEKLLFACDDMDLALASRAYQEYPTADIMQAVIYLDTIYRQEHGHYYQNTR